MDADKRSDPPKVLQILDPLKEADSDTSSVGVDIRENNNAAISQNLVSLQHFQGSQLLPGLSANVHIAVQTHWMLPWTTTYLKQKCSPPLKPDSCSCTQHFVLLTIIVGVLSITVATAHHTAAVVGCSAVFHAKHTMSVTTFHKANQTSSDSEWY